jgi:cytochrome c biogenesis protein CcmG/thiol:disulfide interchange protein DsbE
MKTIIKVLILTALVSYALPAWAAKTVPAFDLKNADGKKRMFDDYASQYELVALVFWSTSCEPCKAELVEINKFADSYEGFGVVAVSIDTTRTSSQVKPYFKGQGFKFETLLDIDGVLQKSLGVPGVPYSVLATAAGDVVWEHSGYRKGDELKMKAEIEKYFAERETPPEDGGPDG